jgi:hypothetical protein
LGPPFLVAFGSVVVLAIWFLSLSFFLNPVGGCRRAVPASGSAGALSGLQSLGVVA